MTPDVAHDDAADDENAGVGGVEPPIPKGGTAGVVDNSVAPLASSFTDDLLIRRAELLRDDRRQQHSEQQGSAEATPAADKGQQCAEAAGINNMQNNTFNFIY